MPGETVGADVPERGLHRIGLGVSRLPVRQGACIVAIEALAAALVVLGERSVTVGRELTKQFEEIATMPAQNLSTWLAGNPQRTRGEFALVVHAQAQARSEGSDNDRLLKILLQELPLKTAVKVAAEISGEAKNALYDRALELKQAAAE